jgi:thiamine biosynthesis lipoprotein
LRRRWLNRGTPAHHLIDPATGCPAFTGVASVGVVAAGAAQSEVLAKTAYLAGPTAGLDLLHRHGVGGVIVTDDGMVHTVGQMVRLDA